MDTTGIHREFVCRLASATALAVTTLTITASAHAQNANQITSINPNSAAQGTSSLLVTFTLDTDVPPPPPAGVLPTSVTIGSLSGSSITHSVQDTVTATFDIPSGEPTGAKDATVTFDTPNGTLEFTMVGGFTVTAGADTPPTITQHPVSQNAIIGGSVMFTVAASGSEPLSYQWQKDMSDIGGATASSFVIHPVDETDEGNYRCIVTNDFGSDTSNEGTLTVSPPPTNNYPIVDTAQDTCYDTSSFITCPSAGSPFYGQDAQYTGYSPSYTISGDELTVYDNITGLTWTRDADWDNDGDIDVDDKVTYAGAQPLVDTLNAQNYGGFSDWRVPSIKELYSLMDFRGTDPSACNTEADCPGLVPYIDNSYFEFAYGDTGAGERVIDSQWVTTSLYTGTVMGGQQAMFGVNFADGRIKGYPTNNKTFYARFCRGNTDYGTNNFTDNGDGTVTDSATGLMWSQDDSGDGINTGPRSGMIWEDALSWVEQRNAESYLGYNDWRLPDAKELHSILDYTRSPDHTSSAAIDPVFNITQITNEAGESDYPWFWSGTTHLRHDGSAAAAAYVCFGKSTGYWNSQWQDVHGAGAQRSDDKSGSFTGYSYVSDGYYLPQAPQGDAARMYNYVRCVRTVYCDADLDRNGQVDNDDLDLFVDCATGPAMPIIDSQCEVADIDGDGDADQADFGELQRKLGTTGGICE